MGAITIDSTTTTESYCANNGTINIYAHSNSLLLYAIIGGPEIRPTQSGNQFGALPQGSYQIMLTNFSNDTAFSSAIITGNYIFPDFSPAFTHPNCPGSSSGTITGNGNIGTGRAPYMWALTQISTGIVTTQSTDTFTHLSAGDYSVRLYDSCQAFATRFVTLTDPNSNFQIDYVFNNFIACDTNVVSIVVTPNNGFWATPFIVSIFTGTQTKVDTFYPALTPNDLLYYIQDTIANMQYGDGSYVMVTNVCGQTAFHGSSVDPWNPQVTYAPVTDSCQPKVRASFALTNVFPPTTAFHAPIFFQVWDLTLGTTVDSSTFSTSTTTYYPPYFLLPNHSYKMQVSDSCGNSTIRFFTTPIPDTTRVYVAKYSYSCLDSTGAAEIHCINFSPGSTTLTLLSGPAIAQSSTPYFAHRDTIMYPISNFSPNSCSSYGANEVCFSIVGLPVGIYTYLVTDSCGNNYTDTIVIRTTDIAVYSFELNVQKGCPGQNKIKYQLHHVLYNYIQDFFKLYSVDSSFVIDSLQNDSAAFANLDAGTYRITHRVNYYSNIVNLVSSSMICTVISDTIIIPAYQLPKIGYAIQIKCNGTVNVGLQADSSFGVAPYDYEVISGPQTTNVQVSNFFQLTQPGNYVARISDICGFARTFSFYVDTLAFQQIVKAGSSCVGNIATLISQHSPYATYIWQKPNGSFYTGDSLVISPVTPADYGTYQIQKIVNVNNCTDTFYTPYLLVANASATINASICNGQSFSLNGNILTQTGVYFDTIPTIGCDSIVQLNLVVNGTLHDTISQIICAGQSFSIGTKTYNATGAYLDTFSTSGGCDSIRLLNLQVKNVLRDTVSQTICAGQSITIGTKTYDATGAYLDTFSTSGGCDSIRLLSLQVTNVLRDTISQTICAGQSIAIGTKTYDATGAYLDTLSTSGGCDSIRLLNLQVEPPKHDSINLSFCEGESVILNGQVYSQAGIYYDTLSTSTCDSIVTIRITTTPRPYFQIEASAYEINQGDTVQLNAISNQQLNYHWTSNAVLSNNAIQQPVATILTSSWIVTQASDTNNCFATDSVFIAVKDCDGNVFIPNAFTPNGDGTNDDFLVYGNCILFQRLLVFNRWGEKVFDSPNINRGWNGYYKGELQMPGVFVYLVTYSGLRSQQTEIRKGSVTLLR